MTRPLGSWLFALPVVAISAAALTLGTAQAQTSSRSEVKSEVRAARPGAIESLLGLFQNEQRGDVEAPPAGPTLAQSLNPNRIESESLPPPGFATPNGAPPPVGHQLLDRPPASAVAPAMRPPGEVGVSSRPVPPAAPPSTVMTLPPEDQPEQGQPKELPENLKKQLVDYATKEPAGTIIVDTSNTYLYLVLGGGKALRYGIGVGREGFTWTGTERISKMSEWPDWHPPTEMIDRQPYLPRFMAGGPGNPLGARALYLGKTLYRIHGTNQPSTIGQTVSSGCIRLLNGDIEDLYSRVQVGSRVVVLPGKAPETVANSGALPTGGAPVAGAPTNIAPALNPAPVSPTAVSGAPPPALR